MKFRVVTGQQLGLLGGPLYTTYKVMGAIHRAREIRGEAIYWLESNDADFREINHIHYLDRSGRLRKLTWNLSTGGATCGSIPIDRGLVKILNQFFEEIEQTSHTQKLREMVLEAYKPGHSLLTASLALARRLFSAFDLRYFHPQDADFRKFTQPLLRREAERTVPGNQCNAFYLKGSRREALI